MFIIDDILAVLGVAAISGAVGGAVGGLAACVICNLIDDKSLKTSAKEINDKAFKLLIKEKKAKAVNVGIFDQKDKLLEDVEIKSEKGVSSSIYKGKVIYI